MLENQQRELEKYLQEQTKNEFGLLKKWTNNVLCTQDFEADLTNLVALELKKILTQDFNKLMELLYKWDLNERKVRETFGDKTETEVAKELAQLYIDRMKQKWMTRQLFKSDEEGDW